jgi:hypothetical protein
LTGSNGERLQSDKAVFNFVPVSIDSNMSQDQAAAIYNELLNG